MHIFPAIDILDGKAVRLMQGDYSRQEIFGADPVEFALQFTSEGARHLHVVDLNGAKEGKPVNFESIKRILEATGVFVEYGGGIRNEATVSTLLEIGVSRVILGTSALKDKEFTKKMLQVYKEHIAIGVDARDQKVAIDGWTSTTEIDSVDFCKEMKDIGATCIIYTDISKDGTLKGTNLSVYERISQIEDIHLVASGGISSLYEIEQLKVMGIYAAILGKAIYTNHIDLKEAIRIAEGEDR